MSEQNDSKSEEQESVTEAEGSTTDQQLDKYRFYTAKKSF